MFNFDYWLNEEVNTKNKRKQHCNKCNEIEFGLIVS